MIKKSLLITKVAILRISSVTSIAKTAIIHHMVMSAIFPVSFDALHLLNRKGFAAGYLWLITDEKTDAFKSKHGVQITPKMSISSQRIGGMTIWTVTLSIVIPIPRR